MARISTYQRDTVVTKNDKVIGTDSAGSVTKNFKLEDLSNFFSTSITVAGQAGYRFKNELGNGIISGFSNNDAFSALTTFKISEVDAAGHNIENFLQEYKNKRIILVQVDNKNNYGIYDVENIVEDTGNSNYYDFTLEYHSGNGNLILDKYYILAMYAQDAEYKHNQQLASNTWVINHNLNKFPSVSIKFSGGAQLYTNVGAFAGVTYTNKNSLTINLATELSGYAYLN